MEEEIVLLKFDSVRKQFNSPLNFEKLVSDEQKNSIKTASSDTQILH